MSVEESPVPSPEAGPSSKPPATLPEEFTKSNSTGKPPKPLKTKGPKPSKKIQQYSNLRGRPDDSLKSRISKTIAHLLRHSGISQGLTVRSDGYVPLSELLSHKALEPQNLTLSSMEDIVKEDSKGRYSLLEEDGVWFMRANQGHSLTSEGKGDGESSPLIDLGMLEITLENIEEAGVCCHGTKINLFEPILAKGLSKMTRHHIHFSPFPPATSSSQRRQPSSPPDKPAPSLMRPNCSLFIYINLPKLLAPASNIKLFKSTNGVVLSPGDEKGFISSDYWLKVEGKDGKVIWEADKKSLS